jgi:hypothetical protein
MGSRNQPRDWRGRWTTTGAGRRLGSQRQNFAQALQAQPGGDNDGRSTVYAYLRDKDSAGGKAGSPYYIGVAGDRARPYDKHGRTPVPQDERRIRMLRSNVTHDQARMWEKFYIAKFGRKDIHSGRQMLLNRTDGGEGVTGLKHSASSRQKMSDLAKKRAPASQETLRKRSEAQKGRRHTPETIAKMRESKRHQTAETRAKSSATQKQNAAKRYGISIDQYNSLTAKNRRAMAARFHRGKRGADLTDGLL